MASGIFLIDLRDNESGIIGQQTELTLIAKARFGQAAEMRPRLLALLQERLAETEVDLVD